NPGGKRAIRARFSAEHHLDRRRVRDRAPIYAEDLAAAACLVRATDDGQQGDKTRNNTGVSDPLDRAPPRWLSSASSPSCDPLRVPAAVHRVNGDGLSLNCVYARSS